MNIKSRLAVVMAVPLGTLVAFVLLAWFQFGAVARKTQPVYGTHIPSLVAASESTRASTSSRWTSSSTCSSQTRTRCDRAGPIPDGRRGAREAVQGVRERYPLDDETQKRTREVRTLMQRGSTRARRQS